MRREILLELRRRVARGLDASLAAAVGVRATLDPAFDPASVLAALTERRELRFRESGGVDRRLVPDEEVRLGEDLPTDVLEGSAVGQVFGCVLPGDDDPAEDMPSTVGRTWEVVVALSVGVEDDDPFAWIAVEEALAAVLQEVESDRRLGGLLTLDIVRGEVGSIVREAGGKVVGASVAYELTYSEAGLGAGDPWMDPTVPAPAGAG